MCSCWYEKTNGTIAKRSCDATQQAEREKTGDPCGFMAGEEVSEEGALRALRRIWTIRAQIRGYREQAPLERSEEDELSFERNVRRMIRNEIDN